MSSAPAQVCCCRTAAHVWRASGARADVPDTGARCGSSCQIVLGMTRLCPPPAPPLPRLPLGFQYNACTAPGLPTTGLCFCSLLHAVVACRTVCQRSRDRQKPAKNANQTPLPWGHMGTWCSGITSASHAEGPGFNPQCVHISSAPPRPALKAVGRVCNAKKLGNWPSGMGPNIPVCAAPCIEE